MQRCVRVDGFTSNLLSTSKLRNCQEINWLMQTELTCLYKGTKLTYTDIRICTFSRFIPKMLAHPIKEGKYCTSFSVNHT